MRKSLAHIAALALATPVLVVSGSSTADAADCVEWVRNYTTSGSKYAVLRNVCGRAVDGKAVVNNWPDSHCVRISAHDTRSVRTGGRFSPGAHRGDEC